MSEQKKTGPSTPKQIIADIKAALIEVPALDLDTAQLVREGDHYECPVCDDGLIPAKDFTNIDGIALGVQFFGVGKGFGDAEKYFDAVLPGKVGVLLAEVARLRALVEVLAKGIDAVSGLISESHGVAGLHRNGDDAPWGELREGGRYEAWLIDLDAAVAALAQKPSEAQS